MRKKITPEKLLDKWRAGLSTPALKAAYKRMNWKDRRHFRALIRREMFEQKEALEVLALAEYSEAMKPSDISAEAGRQKLKIYGRAKYQLRDITLPIPRPPKYLIVALHQMEDETWWVAIRWWVKHPKNDYLVPLRSGMFLPFELVPDVIRRLQTLYDNWRIEYERTDSDKAEPGTTV